MSAPALDKLRDEIAARLYVDYDSLRRTEQDAADIMSIITRHIPADVLAGLLDGTLVAVPEESLP